MKTIRTKVYQFSELSDKAKQKAIEQFSDINVDYDWWQSTYEDAANIGLKITSFDLDRNRHAKGQFTDCANEVAAKILIEHGKDCETYKTAQSYLQDIEDIKSKANAAYLEELKEYTEDENPLTFDEFLEENFADELDTEADNFKQSLIEDYSIILQNECEYLQSDEAIIETIECNQYDFTEDGKRFNR